MRLNEIYNQDIIITSNPKYIITESKDSTIMLDVDETLLTFDLLSIELLEALQSQSINLDIQHSKLVGVLDIMEALDDYSYKKYLKLIEHPKRGHVMIIFRPFLKEFISTLSSLSKDKAKDVVMVTANEGSIRKLYQQLIYEYTGINIPVINPMEYDLHPDSIMVDDDYRLGLTKYATTLKDKTERTQHIVKNIRGGSQNVINIKAFRGDLSDTELNNVLSDINQIL